MEEEDEESDYDEEEGMGLELASGAIKVNVWKQGRKVRAWVRVCLSGGNALASSTTIVPQTHPIHHHHPKHSWRSACTSTSSPR